MFPFLFGEENMDRQDGQDEKLENDRQACVLRLLSGFSIEASDGLISNRRSLLDDAKILNPMSQPSEEGRSRR
jgi:hypothetical protein